MRLEYHANFTVGHLSHRFDRAFDLGRVVRVIVVYFCTSPLPYNLKPSFYSRTARFLSEFAHALSLADDVILCDISAIREEAIKGVSSERIARLIGARAVRLDDSLVATRVDEIGADAVIIMGAANLDGVKRDIIGK